MVQSGKNPATTAPTPSERWRSRGTLLALVALLYASQRTLLALVGTPRLPAGVPSIEEVLAALRSTEPPLDVLLYGAGTMAWLVWAWLVLSISLSVLVALLAFLARVPGGTAAVARGAGDLPLRAAARVSETVSPPVIRKLAEYALPAIVIARLATSAAPAFAATPPSNPIVRAVAVADQRERSLPTGERREAARVEHEVRPGESLWSIAERFYGEGRGERFRDVYEANRGRVMPGGVLFEQGRGVIQPGWVLEIPGPLPELHAAGPGSSAPNAPENRGTAEYTTRRGDMLRTIAGRFLGDEGRWPEVYALNHAVIGPDPDELATGVELAIPATGAGAAGEDREATPRSEEADDAEAAETAQERGAQGDGGREREGSGRQPGRVSVSGASAGAKAVTAARDEAAPTGGDGRGREAARRSEPRNEPVPRRTAAHGGQATAPAVFAPSIGFPRAERTPAASGQPGAEAGAPAQVSERGDVGGSGAPPAALALGGLAALGAAGAVWTTAGRRRLRKPLGTVLSAHYAGSPDPDSPTAAPPTGARGVSGGGAKPDLVVGRVAEFLADAGLAGTRLVWVRQGREVIELLLAGDLGPRGELQRLGSDIAAGLGIAVARIRETPDGDVSLTLGKLGRVVLRPATRTGAGPSPLLLPVGRGGGDVYFVEWGGAGNVLVGGGPAAGGEEVLANVLSGLAARRRPGELGLWTLAGGGALPDGLGELPHQELPSFVAPSDAAGVAAVLDRLRGEMVEREVSGASSRELVLVVGELADLTADPHLLSMLAEYGPEQGVRLVAHTARPRAVAEEVLDLFATRLCLQMDETQSVRLLGRPDAAALQPGAELLLRSGNRLPLRLEALRTGSAELAPLLAEIRRAPGGGRPPRQTWRAAAALDGAAPERVAGAIAVDTAPNPVPVPAAPAGTDAGPLAASDEPRARTAPAPSTESSAGAAVREATADPTSGGATTSPSAVAAGETESVEARIALARTDAWVHALCLGPFAVLSRDGRELAPRLANGRHCLKEWELLAYLVSRPGMKVGRDRLLDDLYRRADIAAEERKRQKARTRPLSEAEIDARYWSEEYAARIGQRLHSCANRLRTLLAEQAGEGFDGSSALRVEPASSGGAVSLSPELVYSDALHVERLRRRLAQTRASESAPLIEELRSLFRGDFLEHAEYAWTGEDADGVDPREAYRKVYDEATMKLADLYASRGEYRRAARLYRALLEGDPDLEGEVCPKLYQCLFELGDRTGLLKAHEQLLDTLAAGGYSPEHETVRVYRRLIGELDAAEEHGELATSG